MRPDTCASKNIAWVSGARRETKLSEEYERWEARYSAPDYIFGKAPNYFLAKCKPMLPASGRVLAVCAREGRHIVWPSEEGSPFDQSTSSRRSSPMRLCS